MRIGLLLSALCGFYAALWPWPLLFDQELQGLISLLIVVVIVVVIVVIVVVVLLLVGRPLQKTQGFDIDREKS